MKSRNSTLTVFQRKLAALPLRLAALKKQQELRKLREQKQRKIAAARERREAKCEANKRDKLVKGQAWKARRDARCQCGQCKICVKRIKNREANKQSRIKLNDRGGFYWMNEELDPVQSLYQKELAQTITRSRGYF